MNNILLKLIFCTRAVVFGTPLRCSSCQQEWKR